MLSSTEFFEEISSDRLHGASQIYAKFLSLLRTYLQQLGEVSGEFVQSLPKTIVGVRSDMAPFYYAALRVSGLVATPAESDKPQGEQIMELVKQLQAEQGAAIDRIVDKAKPVVAGAGAIMLHSNSATVTAIVKRLLPQGTKIFLSEALPDHEGERLGEELAPAGYEVTVFPDDAKYRYVQKVDLVLLGSDWVAEDGFVNKIGSSCVALAAVNENKPVIVAADGSKLVPAKFRRLHKANRVRLSKRLYRETCLFEKVDNQLADQFVTDLGLFSASEIAAFVRTRLQYVNFTLK